MDECKIFLLPQLINDNPTRNRLLAQTSSLVLRLNDPAPLIDFLTRLIESCTFQEILSLQPAPDIANGLSLEVPLFNQLTLGILGKAAANAQDAARVAMMPQAIYALVNLWLCTPDTGIAEQASDVMLRFLITDKESSEVPVHGVGDDAVAPSGGQGLFWRRLFGDKDIYSLILSTCDYRDGAQTGMTSRSKTLCQARLMSFAPKLGQLDWNYLSESHHPEIEQAHGLKPHKEGLLDFIALIMTDYQNDVLIHINLIQFFGDLITLVQTPIQR